MFKPDKIHIDIETYSSVDLKKCGVHKYAASPDFEIMLVTFGYYSADGERVYEQYEPSNGKPIPRSRLQWLEDADVLKLAFNAMFERVCFGAFLGCTLDPEQWRCVMVMCGFSGLPLGLSKVSKLLNLDNVKLAGTSLINHFAVPRKPTKNNPNTRNLPIDSPQKWEDYKEYNLADVATEWDIEENLITKGVRVPELEWVYYTLDQRVNDRGVYMDADMIEKAVTFDVELKAEVNKQISVITDIDTPNSIVKVLRWLQDNGCSDLEDLKKDTIKNVLRDMPDGVAKEVLLLRSQSAKTSTKKYSAASQCIESDGRARGLYAFNGAYRTGRYAGRRVQMQNLARINFAKGKTEKRIITTARNAVKSGCPDLFSMMYEKPIDILSQLIRTIFTGAPGHSIVAADYSAIEARVLAWLAGETWKLDVFRTHGKIYEATAARMFGVPFESVTEGSDLRQSGKMGELAFGYGGSVGAVDAMGYFDDGRLTAEEVLVMVKKWRKENPNIVRAWGNYEKAAIDAVTHRGQVFSANRCHFYANDDRLFIELPSGRELAYYNPTLKMNKFGSLSLHYEGENDSKQWVTLSTYGGKLTENIAQAVSRDLLCDAQLRLAKEGYNIVLHVHDEVGCEVADSEAEQALKFMCGIMAINPSWADGLPLKADGFVSKFYKK